MIKAFDGHKKIPARKMEINKIFIFKWAKWTKQRKKDDKTKGKGIK